MTPVTLTETQLLAEVLDQIELDRSGIPFVEDLTVQPPRETLLVGANQSIERIPCRSSEETP